MPEPGTIATAVCEECHRERVCSWSIVWHPHWCCRDCWPAWLQWGSGEEG